MCAWVLRAHAGMGKPEYVVTRSERAGKKYRVALPGGGSVHFGASGYEDYTTHKDHHRMQAYVRRHSTGREDWSASGVATPGFWARWLLWSEPSLDAAAKRIGRMLDAKVRVDLR